MNATSPSPVPAPTGRRRDLRFALAALALVVAHCAAAAYFDPPSVIFGKRPISGSDFDTHIEQTWRVLEGLEPAGKTWVYDHPFFLILNLAVGGPWPGNPDGSTVFPQTLTVDYVRVYEPN